MIVRFVGSFLAIFLFYMSMFFAGLTSGLSALNYWNLEGLIVVVMISYFCTVSGTGKFKLDLNAYKLMHKLIMPVSWIGFLIGFIIILLSFSTTIVNSENFLPRLFQSISISLITVFYGLITKVILTIIIDSKSNN
jgi:hypothetical protein